MNKLKKIVRFFSILLVAGILFFGTITYFGFKKLYLNKKEGHVINRYKSRGVGDPTVVLSDGSKVSLTSYYKLGYVNLKDTDTLIKPKRSFKIYHKRTGIIKDSFKNVIYNYPTSWLIRKVY